MSHGDDAGRASNRSPDGKGGLKPALPASDESPGVPGFRTWRGVYAFVLIVFIAVVLALAVFSRIYA